jgi:hypothetical protein
MSLTKTATLLLAFCFTVSAPEMGQDSESAVLFVVQRPWHGRGYVVEPFALLVDDSLVEPPSGGADSLSESFRDVYYQPGVRYTTLSAGRRWGEVMVVERPGVEACAWLGAEVVLVDSASERIFQNLLATNRPGLGGSQPLARQPTPTERQAVSAIATDWYQRKGKPDDVSGPVEELEIVVVEPGIAVGPDVVAAGYVQKDAAGYHTNSLFVIGQSRADTFLVDHLWSKDITNPYGTDIQVRQPLDVIDLDGDGMPELVTKTSHYEWVTYQVYAWDGGQWAEMYDGFGGGC